jgi:hypothetical protein
MSQLRVRGSDGASVYVASEESSAVASFSRELAPTCVALASNVGAGTPIAILLSCTDLNLDPLTLAFVATPAHGILGAIDQATGTVLYTPVAGYSGPDSFTYNASDGTLASNTATVSLSVAAAAPGPVPPSAIVPPRITSATESHRTWRRGTKLATLSKGGQKKLPIGTTFTFALNEPASVGLAFTQEVGGRKVKGKCVAQTGSNRRHGACKRTVTRGTLRFTARAGTNRISFQGRITASKKLNPGRYALVITATNTARQSSQPKSLSFTIAQ